MATRIKEKYLAEAVPALQQKFGYKNVMEIPKLEKIVINMGLGDCKDNAKSLEVAVNELTAIAGQKPLVTKAKKSIANFKLREGMPVGCKVTLRGDGNLGTEECTLADIRGIALAFYRKGRSTPDYTSGRKWRIYSAIWTRLLPIRRYLLYIYRKVNRLER